MAKCGGTIANSPSPTGNPDGRWDAVARRGSISTEGALTLRFAHGWGKYTFLLLLALLVFYGGLYALWLWGNHDLYFSLMQYLHTDPYKVPFIDMEGPLSWAECHRLGYDVIAVNPCDPMNRPLNYSPLLLYLPLKVGDNVWFSLLWNGAFLLALPAVLRPRGRGEFWVSLFACLSTALVFAVERANPDIVEFVLIALTALVVGRGGPGRLAAYALYWVGAAIKFYPFALLLTLLLERPSRMIAIGTASVALLAVFAWRYHTDLARMAALLPAVKYYGNQFYAFILPFGGAAYVGLPPSFGGLFFVLLLFGAGGLALRYCRLLAPHLDPSGWTKPRRHLLLCGSIILLGCFFTQPNLIYRAIFLLFLLPGLFDLNAATGRAGTAPARAIAVTLYLLWSELFRLLLDRVDGWLLATYRLSTDALDAVFFVSRELMWWWLMSLLAAILLRFVQTAPAWRALDEMLRSGRGANFRLKRV